MISVLLIVSVLLLRYERRLEKARTAIQVEIPDGISPGECATLTSRDGTVYRYYRKGGTAKRFFGYGIGGFFQGGTGFGIGEMGIISMMLTRIPTRVAVGTSHLIVASTAVVASLAHFFLAASVAGGGTFPWNIPLMTVPALVIGGQLAPYVTSRIKVQYLERFISTLFVAIAAALIFLATRAFFAPV